MKKKTNGIVTIVVILLLGLVSFAVKHCRNSGPGESARTVTAEPGDWRHHKLIYTSHARCRMECRDISEEEVEYVLLNGIINEDKSKEMEDEAAGHCPTFALEANTKDGQHVRIVFGACDKITRVITAIDLDKEHQCDCR